ncbi:MAG TPA: hypothetical protein VJJ80_02290 [Patescibacteria group bacterium]|nr:hypothetical protein [Patescibacteria group bacterium]
MDAGEPTSNLEEQTPTPKSGGSKILWIIIPILILGLAVLGWGFYGGIKTKKIATEVESKIAENEQKWQIDELLNPTEKVNSAEDVAALKADYQEVYDDSTAGLAKLETLKGTRKTAALEADLARFYQLTQKASGNAITMLNYLQEMQKISSSFPTVDATGVAELKTQLTAFKASVDKSLATLKTIKTTPSLEATNKSMVTGLTQLSGLLGQAITALDNNRPDQVQSLLAGFATSASSFESVKMPDQTAMKNDIATDSEVAEIKSLITSIKAKVATCKTVIFTF